MADVLAEAASRARSHSSDAIKPRGRNKWSANRTGTRSFHTRRPAAPAPEITDSKSIVVQRYELVGEVNTGEPLRLQQFPEDRQGEETGQEVEIKAEVVQQHVEFLQTYVAGLLRAQERNPDIFNDERFAPERRMIDKLSFLQADERNIEVRKVVNEAKIREYLRSGGAAWAETTLAMEEYVVLAEMGLGLREQIQPKWGHGQMDGSLRPIIADQSIHTLRTWFATVGSRLSAIGGGALWWTFGGTDRTVIDHIPDSQLLHFFQTDPRLAAERDLIFAMSGVDVRTLPAEPENNPMYQSVQKSIENAYAARKNLYTTLGLSEPPTHFRGRDIDRNTEIRSLHEFAVNPNARPEMLPYIFDQRAIREYTDLGIANPAYLATATGRLYLMDLAIRRVRIQLAEEGAAVDEGAREGARSREYSAALKRKAEEVRRSGYADERRARHQETIRTATADKTKVEPRREELTKEGSLFDSENKVRKIEGELAALGVDITDDIDRAIDVRIEQLRDQINTAMGQNVPGTVPPETLGQVLARRTTEINDARTARYEEWRDAQTAATRASVPRPTADEIAEGTRVIEEQFALVLGAAGENYTRLMQQLSMLQARRSEYSTAVDGRDEAMRKLAYAGERDKLRAAETARANLTAATLTLNLPGGARTPTDADIRDLSANVIAEALADVPPPAPPAPPHPWGTTNAERLQYIFHAKAQLRLAALSPRQQAAVTELSGLGFDSDAISIRSTAELVDLLAADYRGTVTPARWGTPLMTPAGPMAPWPPATSAEIYTVSVALARRQVRAAREGVARQLREIEDARLTVEIEHYTAIENEAQRQIDALGNIDNLRTDIVVAAATWDEKNREKVYVEAVTMVDRTGMGTPADRLARLGIDVGIGPTAADMTFSEQERNSGLSQEVLRWYEFVYPEYRTATNRGEAFEALRRALPEQVLADIIGRELGLGTAPGTTINDVLDAFYTNATNPNLRFNSRQMRRLARVLIRHVRDYGLALG